MDKKAPFDGVGVALITLFDASGALDVTGTVDHAERLVDVGLRAVLVNGTTGEVAHLSVNERNELLSAMVSRLGSRATVVAGVGASTIDEACSLAEHALALGAQCVLSPPSKDVSVVEHYSRVVEADRPVIAYHWPKKYPPGVDLSDLGSVIGIKDSTGDPKRLFDEVTGTKVPVYVGSSSLLLLSAAVGATGALVGSANAFPELSLAAFAGDNEAQRELHVRQQLPFPAGIKRLAADRFGTSTFTR
jgi:4-hydroxy-tetrahydrodipicolinate synthase